MSILKNPAVWERVLMFAPHPDDESLAAGGFLQRAIQAGATVRVVFVTNGDNNPWAQRALERCWRIGAEERARWGKRRRQEAASALAHLGVPAESARFLNIPDQGTTRLLLNGDASVIQSIADEIAEFNPKLLVTPAIRDVHRDHNSFAVLLQLALARLSAGQKQFIEINYVIHQDKGNISARADFTLRLSSAEQERKRQAILCHTTQMKLSRRRFLAFAAEIENFTIQVQPKENDESHPVQSACIDRQNLRLKLAPRSFREGMFGRRILHIVADNTQGNSSTRSIVLPARSAQINVTDFVSDSILTQAVFRKCGPENELILPLSLFPLAQRIFVKLEKEFRFCDLAGWREIPLPVREKKFPSALSDAFVSPRLCCLVPCYNVAASCGEVLRRVAELVDCVVAINDGSTDNTAAVLNSIAGESGGRIRVCSYPNNGGKGVALMEGFRLALAEIPFDLLVTIDADGQHDPGDITRVAALWSDHRPGLIIGERLELKVMPLRSRFGNSLTSTILRRFYPASPRDTQSGLRGMDYSLVTEIVRCIKPQRYETELRILLLALELRRSIGTIAIQTIYFERNRLSHFRPILDSLRIYWVLLQGICRFFFGRRTRVSSGDSLSREKQDCAIN